MLPQDVKDDLKRITMLNAPCEAIIKYLHKEQSPWTDTQIAQARMQMRVASLPTGKRRPVHMLQDATGDDSPQQQSASDNSSATSTTATDPAAVETLNLVCATLDKLSKERGRDVRTGKDTQRSRTPSRDRPESTVKGCWHCGKEGHSRTTGRGADRKPRCPEF